MVSHFWQVPNAFFHKKSVIFMKTDSFAFYLKVDNLDLCRSFYRDLLGLGSPVTDSNFWVEFEITGNVKLILEKSNAPYLEHSSSAAAFTIYTDEAEATAERLEAAGYKLCKTEDERSGGTFLRCLDPEGNPFFLSRPE
jgi:predicted enzyme related to lactoylglutathione lyase